MGVTNNSIILPASPLWSKAAAMHPEVIIRRKEHEIGPTLVSEQCGKQRQVAAAALLLPRPLCPMVRGSCWEATATLEKV